GLPCFYPDNSLLPFGKEGDPSRDRRADQDPRKGEGTGASVGWTRRFRAHAYLPQVKEQPCVRRSGAADHDPSDEIKALAKRIRVLEESIKIAKGELEPIKSQISRKICQGLEEYHERLWRDVLEKLLDLATAQGRHQAFQDYL